METLSSERERVCTPDCFKPTVRDEDLFIGSKPKCLAVGFKPPVRDGDLKSLESFMSSSAGFKPTVRDGDHSSFIIFFVVVIVLSPL